MTPPVVSRVRHLVRRLERLRPGPRAVILAYHRVAAPEYDPYGQAVSPDTFARQLRHLRREYEVVALHDLVARLPDRSYADGTVAVTFDDGYVDSFTAAYPVARHLDVPMTVFVTAEPVLEGRAFWWDQLAASSARDDGGADPTLHARLKRLGGSARRQMLESLASRPVSEAELRTVGRPTTADELRQFAGLPGLTIGSHTASHPMLSALSVEEQGRELTASKRMLEELIGLPVDLVAYPFGKRGDVSRATFRLAARAGYAAGFLTVPKAVYPTTNRFALPRLTVHAWSDEAFARRVRELFGRDHAG